MPDQQPTDPDTPGPCAETIESGILDRLVHDDQRPWSVEELIRDIGERLGVVDAITTLQHIGLIHRCGDLISQPAQPSAPKNWRYSRAEESPVMRIGDSSQRRPTNPVDVHPMALVRHAPSDLVNA
jgi:hypothetical protein